MAIPNLPSGACVLVSFRGNCAAQRIINTFNYRVTSGATAGVPYTDYLLSMYQAIDAAGGLKEKFLDTQATNYTLEKTRIQVLYPFRLRYSDFGAPASGTFPAVANLQNAAASIERTGLLIGREGVGRIQLVIPDGQVIEGTIVNVNNYVTLMTTLATEMVAPVVSAAPAMTWNPCIGLDNSASLGLNDLMGAIPKDTSRVMRRRTLFLGE